MTKVKFYNVHHIDNKKISFAAIVAKYKDHWVFIKDKNESTWRIPCGYHESNEHIEKYAEKELMKTVGAKKFQISPVCMCSVVEDENEFLGQLFYAKIDELDEMEKLEVEDIEFFDTLPKNLTYPAVQSFLFKKALNYEKSKRQ
ncbi:NUDIX hydrolase [Clostridium senegalense]|uniref:NUDIX hydrolase n=1 Tax=Clostridium senegalense TaxID=1465809 RepID=UPI000287DF1F|nr:NUDIX hydrolase [Clostridium senegalense]